MIELLILLLLQSAGEGAGGEGGGPGGARRGGHGGGRGKRWWEKQQPLFVSGKSRSEFEDEQHELEVRQWLRQIERDERIQKRLVQKAIDRHGEAIQLREDTIQQINLKQFVSEMPSPILSEDLRKLQNELDETKKRNRIKMAKLRSRIGRK